MPERIDLIAFLKKMGLNLPPASVPLTLLQQIEADKKAKEEQAKWSPINQTVDKIGQFGSGILSGLLGTEPDSTRKGIQDYTNLAVQGAGMPFAAYKALKKLPFNKVFHGTSNNFEKFNPQLNNKNDVLGWLTHAAEDPEYSAGYTNRSGNHQRIIPMEPEAKNVLDLVEPNSDDISQILASVEPQQRIKLIQQFKNARRDPIRARGNLDKDHFPGAIDLKKVPTITVSENLKLNENSFAKSPFDAIRYNDMNNKSWAMDTNKTPIKTSHGVSLTNDSNSIKILRDSNIGLSKSVLTETSNRPITLRKRLINENPVEELKKKPYLTYDEITNQYETGQITKEEMFKLKQWIIDNH